MDLQSNIQDCDKLQEILSAKKSCSSATLCDGLPIQLHLYFQHIEALNFDDNPNYQRLQTLFQSLLVQNKYEMDYEYDWILFEKGTWKLPPLFCFITTNYFYKFTEKRVPEPGTSKNISRPKIFTKKSFSAFTSPSKVPSNLHAQGSSPMSDLTALKNKPTDSQLQKCSHDSREKERTKPSNNNNDSGIALLDDDIEEEPRISDQITKLSSYSSSLHTFLEVKSKFFLQSPAR